MSIINCLHWAMRRMTIISDLKKGTLKADILITFCSNCLLNFIFFQVNALSLVITAVLPKLPMFHGVRILGINKY